MNKSISPTKGPYNHNHTVADGFWLGANDLKTEGEWIWEYNNKKLDDGWTNWGIINQDSSGGLTGEKEPNNGQGEGREQDCLFIASNLWGTGPISVSYVGENLENYIWIDVDCEKVGGIEPFYFPICEFGD